MKQLNNVLNTWPLLLIVITAFGVGFYCGLSDAKVEMSEIQCEICTIQETKPNNAEKAQYCGELIPQDD